MANSPILNIENLRDKIAGRAMVALIRDQMAPMQADDDRIQCTADKAYSFADAMLKARGVQS